MTRLVCAVVAVCIASGGAAADSTPDPRALFDDGQFEAAAAGFEHRWEATRDPADGLNAVVAWRVAGRYAHARVLLARVVGETPPEGTLAQRAELLDDRLAELTASIVLTAEPAESSMAIDGAPAEWLDGAIVVNVGRRELTVSRAGCEPFVWAGELRPRERVELEPVMVCKERHGNVHVRVSGGVGAIVRIDGERRTVDEFDLDVRLEAGPHRVIVERRGVRLVDQRIEVKPAQTVSFDVDVGWRTKANAVVFGATSIGVADPEGATFGYGATIGYLQGSPRVTRGDKFGAWFLMHLGSARSSRGILDGGLPWLGLDIAFRWWGPLWQKRSGRTLWVLDFDPLAFQFGATQRNPGIFAFGEEAASLWYMHVLPITLHAETPWLHAQLALWPVGITRYRDNVGTDSDTQYSATINLIVGRAFLGN